MQQENWNIRQLKQLLDKKITGMSNDVRKGLENAGKDYSRFFEWEADSVFKSKYMKNYYRIFQNRVNSTDNTDELKAFFDGIIKSQQERLINVKPARYSTNPMANYAHSLSLECTQQLIQDCIGFVYILSIKEPKKDLREKAGQPEKKSNGLKI